MAASNTDKVTDTRNATRPNSARVSSGRSAGGATLACDNLVGWPTASKVHFVTYQIDSNSNPVAGTQLDCYGIRSGNNITSLVVVDGADSGNQVNDVVEMLPTAAWGQDLADALTTAHDRTGVHKAGATYPTPVIADLSNATHTHANAAGGGQLSGSAIAPGSQLADRLLNPYKFSVYRQSALSIGASGVTVITFDTKRFDTGSNVDIATNKGRFTAPIAGFYQLSAQVAMNGLAGTFYFIMLYKNGAEFLRGDRKIAGSDGVVYYTLNSLIQSAANDYWEIYMFSTSAGTSPIEIVGTPDVNNYFTGFLVSAT